MGAYFGFMYEVEYEYARHHKMQCAVCRGVICVSCSVSVNRYVCTPRGTYHISCFDLVHFVVVAILDGGNAMTTKWWISTLLAIINQAPQHLLDKQDRHRARRLCRETWVALFYRHVGGLIFRDWEWETFDNTQLLDHPGAQVLLLVWREKRQEGCTKIAEATNMPACICAIIGGYIHQHWLLAR